MVHHQEVSQNPLLKTSKKAILPLPNYCCHSKAKLFTSLFKKLPDIFDFFYILHYSIRATFLRACLFDNDWAVSSFLILYVPSWSVVNNGGNR